MPSRHVDEPLRRDVHLLGTILGNVLVEQVGPELLDAVEHVRVLSRAARERGEVAAVADAVSLLSPDDQALVLRAFGLYFQLANIAEQHHRLRRRRTRDASEEPMRETLGEALRALSD